MEDIIPFSAEWPPFFLRGGVQLSATRDSEAAIVDYEAAAEIGT